MREILNLKFKIDGESDKVDHTTDDAEIIKCEQRKQKQYKHDKFK
jgi:hypothetical protein